MLNRLLDVLITLITQYPWPHHAISRWMHNLTRARFKPWKTWQINWFIKRYQVDLTQLTEPDLKRYENFNQFFTRSLIPTARPIVFGANTIACPVDGRVSQAGEIVNGQLFQAKGHTYSLEQLLGGDPKHATPFQDGHFATIYLSPRDYHRIHMPLSGELKKMVYIPGKLFSVSPRTTRTIPRLFARNERVVTLFDTECGPMALILVGALFVGSIETTWAGVIAPRDSSTIEVWDYTSRLANNQPILLDKGEEMGRFNMGSTVIMLFGPQAIQWTRDITPEATVIMGQKFATR